MIVLVVFSRFLCSFVPCDTSFALYKNRTKQYVFRRSDQGPVVLWSPSYCIHACDQTNYIDSVDVIFVVVVYVDVFDVAVEVDVD